MTDASYDSIIAEQKDALVQRATRALAAVAANNPEVQRHLNDRRTQYGNEARLYGTLDGVYSLPSLPAEDRGQITAVMNDIPRRNGSMLGSFIKAGVDIQEILDTAEQIKEDKATYGNAPKPKGLTK